MNKEVAMLDHERLDVYRLTLKLLATMLPALESLPIGHSKLVDQLRRAGTSIPLNIAEGTGKPAGPDRRRYYAIARGAAMECSAVLDVFRLLGLLPDDVVAPCKAHLVRIVAMLSRMAMATAHGPCGEYQDV